MKKIVLIICLIILTGCIYEKKVIVQDVLKYETSSFEYGDTIHIKDIFTNDFDFEDILLDTSVIGENEVTINYKNNDKSYSETFKYEVKDTTEPLIWLSSSYSVTVGEVENLLDKIICVDNYDKRPNCYIEGDYNLNKVGSYNLKFVAKDSFDNTEQIDFTLNVNEKSKSTSNNSQHDTTDIQDVIDLYKTDSTMIGIDVSKWQGNINWEKVKNAGVEFAIIRLGYQYYFHEDLYIDPYYIKNIEGALANGIAVGIYFYSYATSEEEAIEQANFVIENIKDYDVTLPIAFDWESFSKFNSLNMSLYDLRKTSFAFQDTIKNYGYTPIQYGSKNYLNSFWGNSKYDTWLAHYTSFGSQSNYEKTYTIWQLCNNGKVDGINGDVDIDIYYK